MATITRNFSDNMGNSDRTAFTRTQVRSDLTGLTANHIKTRQLTKSDSEGSTDATKSKERQIIPSDSVGLSSTRRVFPTPLRAYGDTGMTDSFNAQLALVLIATPIDGAALVSLELIMDEWYGFSKFTVERVNADTGAVTPIRGGELQNVDLGTYDLFLYDAECPLSTPDDIGPPIYYIATGYVVDPVSGAIDQEQTVTYFTDSFNLHDSVGAAWIKNPGVAAGVPSSDNKFMMDHMENWTYQTRVLANTNVLGRRCPVIVTDVMGSRSGVMYICSYPEAESIYGFAWSRSQLLGLVSSGGTLFFQTTGNAGIEDFFFKVTGDIQEMQLGTGTPITADRIWSIPFTEVDSPSTNVTNIPGGHSWQEVAENYPSWQAVLDQHSTWQEVLTNG